MPSAEPIIPGAPATPALDLRRAVATWLVLSAGGCAALLAPPVVEGFDALGRRVDMASPYFPGFEPGLVWGLLPLALAGSFALLLGPGLVLALGLGGAATFSRWIVSGFGLSLAAVSVPAAAVQAILGRPLAGAESVATVVATGAAALLFTAWRLRRGRRLPWPVAGSRDFAHALALAVVPAVLAAALAPKIFWEDFNGDGIHAFGACRLLLRGPVPFWPEGSGYMTFFPGTGDCLFTWPVSWFLRLFGENESGARLPYFLFLAVLQAAVVAIAERPDRPPPGGRAHALIWLSLVSYTLVAGYSATYDPWCADFALPATQDTLFMICVLAAFGAFFDGRPAALGVWTFLATLASAGAAPVLLALVPAAVLGCRPRPWRRIAWFLACFAAAAAAGRFLPRALAVAGLPVPGGEHDVGNLLERFKYVWLLDLKRWLWLLVPAGLYPIAVVRDFRRADDATRVLLLVTLQVFALYYGMAFVSLHYFVPVMILPLAAFWRHHRVAGWRRPGLATAACGVAALAAVAAGLPGTTSIYRGNREAGRHFDLSRLPGREEMRPEYTRGIEILEKVLPKDAHPDVPERGFGGAPQAWAWYAGERGGPDPATRAVAVVPEGAPAPAGAELLATDGGVSIHIRDPAAVESLRRVKPAGSPGRWLYAVPRDILFQRREEALQRRGLFAVKKVLEALGYRGG